MISNQEKRKYQRCARNGQQCGVARKGSFLQKTNRYPYLSTSVSIKLQAFDGLDTLAGQSAMPWTGSLRFTWPAPAGTGYTAAQAGVLLHTPADIVQNAQRLYQQVVVTRIMPLGNITKITDEERAVIAAWIRAGAKMEP